MRDEVVRMAARRRRSDRSNKVNQVSGDHAWNVAGKDTAPRLCEANERAHQIVISPHGLLRAAFANNATVTKKTIEGRQMTVISFTDQGKHKVVAYANDQNAIERVESSYGHPVVGDMKVVTYYGPYRDFAGVKFPTKIIQYQDGLADSGSDGYRRQSQSAGGYRGSRPCSQRPRAGEIREGGGWGLVYHGRSHHSVLIEMKDYLIVVEAPHGEQRSMAVMAEVKKLVPNKPIKYLVNTHHHFDHASGVRAYAAEGVTIVTHEVNRPYFERAAVELLDVSP